MQLIYFSVCAVLFVTGTLSQKDVTFLASFQSDGIRSTTQWMKYKGKVAGLDKDFSACHWEKVRYFSLEINSIWAYCFIFSASEKLDNQNCLQLYHNFTSANTEVDMVMYLKKEKYIAISVPFRHREWNHICFTYSSINKVARFYYNGKPVITETSSHFPEILESNDVVFDSSFTIAQEPDTLNGGYNPAQLFNGEISELNIWSKVIDETQISAMARCFSIVKGDIVAWDKQTFVFNNVLAKKINNITKLFC